MNIIFAGVGGQGVLTASEVLARAAMNEGLDCKKSEVHGMAQRGGSVLSHVRFGSRVHSPVIPAGGADFLVAFEMLEGLRHAHNLKPSGTVIVNRLEVHPLTTFTGPGYPTDIQEQLASIGAKVVVLPGQDLAASAGDVRAAGSALLGALSILLPFKAASWEDAFAGTFKPSAAELNIRAFGLGRGWVSGNLV